MRQVRRTIATAALGATLLGACGDTAPSTSSWAARVVATCKDLESRRQDAAKALPSDREPTVDELMKFSAGFSPTFAAFSDKIRALKRPKGNAAAIDELVSATDAYAAHLKKVATDRGVAAAEIAADGQTAESARLEKAASALGLDECNG